ncbi:hypothetical protein FOZ61_007407 [Perkinsus olseni]|uniref:Uncharacterized protein n=1 Tax=Perkinsus olseni TaxID=32597 RepID=A0A7J6M8Y0_PEROL|nr:hypothetical protein FOZ61_007407 [Perkinsus olseni]
MSCKAPDRVQPFRFDVRASTGEEEQFFKTNPGPAGDFLDKIDVQTKLGVSKEYVSPNFEVAAAFDKFTTYDTTSFVTDLLDGGIEVALRGYLFHSVTHRISRSR